MITTNGQVIISGENTKILPRLNGRIVPPNEIIVTGFTFEGSLKKKQKDGWAEVEALEWAIKKLRIALKKAKP